MSAKKKESGAFGVMSVLSYIGNGIWALLFMILLIACITNGTSMQNSGTFDGLFGGMIGVFAAMSALVIIMCWLCISGVAKMKKGNRRGFMFYLIGNGLWIMLLIYAGREGNVTFLSGAVISIVFVTFYAMNLPKMKG
ncbi:MAG: hypothetical protein GQ574_15115 [Crocinitomix sp.]|nr:hypothetical protein [Crocinitomix sp.]